ncbi:MAG: hypothetical protein AB1591_10155 [Pseudomonadota bacterium]
MLKFSLRRAVQFLCAWLIVSPAAQSAEKPSPAEPARPAPAPPFDQYRNFRDEPVADWRKSNDRVNEVGGWRTYLRESFQDGGSAGHDRHRH